ncbi:MAG: type II toxin-antitoxin system RelE/ParE family toxin [Pseudohongiella sp.]|nr:type II toxin-antitoxin system RelE/ParE family toxin [Pseudohongiella sp.]
MSWMITFFSEKVREEMLSFPDGILADFLHVAEIIEQFGPAVGKPYTAPMGAGLFEIRVRGREGIGRSLFCTVEGQEVVILNSFIKKTQKTPSKEIEKARKRMKELKNGENNPAIF